MLLQAYDYVELDGATAAICRWAAPISGATSSPASTSAAAWVKDQLYALTMPLLTTASGAKMGKTAAAPFGSTRDNCRPYDYWQFWRNTEDADVGRFLKLFTFLPLDEIAKLETLSGPKSTKRRRCSRPKRLRCCTAATKPKQLPKPHARRSSRARLAADLPTVEIPLSELEAGLGILAAFVKAGLVASNSEARRQIQGGGSR